MATPMHTQFGYPQSYAMARQRARHHKPLQCYLLTNQIAIIIVP